jgi:hypothetical protein
VTKSHAISAPETTVAAHTMAATVQSTGSRLFVERASFQAAIAMIAITTGPRPKNTSLTCERPWAATT